ncbi:hypothetical protein CKO25_05035 [Thiocapsa imhoffii]|uniref:Uncharacterized protein n=1 Tax=Thiocapsa imhoffii TaxID=382777 RepID=A0A9X1B7N3_9GAMM|nr:hypothetical protein [Thiocapsa imhoffii]
MRPAQGDEARDAEETQQSSEVVTVNQEGHSPAHLLAAAHQEVIPAQPALHAPRQTGKTTSRGDAWLAQA